mgnify:CR=1 FL=1
MTKVGETFTITDVACYTIANITAQAAQLSIPELGGSPRARGLFSNLAADRMRHHVVLAQTSKVPHPRGRAQHWHTADDDLRAFVNETVTELANVLGDRLTAVTVHGSLAAGCFYRAKSDVDLLVVVDRRLSAPDRDRVARTLAAVSAGRPIVGDLEVSVLASEHAQTFRHPSRFEVHYSSMWRDAIVDGRVDHTVDRTDEDLAAHVTVARARGVPLYGPPPREVFGCVPLEAYWESIRSDVAWALDGDHLLESPFYGVLNACRMLLTLDVGVERASAAAYSKEEGGTWALTHVPPEHRPLIEQALACYRSDRAVTPDERRTDGHAWDADALRAFRDYVRCRLSV